MDQGILLVLLGKVKALFKIFFYIREGQTIHVLSNNMRQIVTSLKNAIYPILFFYGVILYYCRICSFYTINLSLAIKLTITYYK